MRRMQAYKVPGITVTFDPNLCWHSAVCLNELPVVFDVGRKRWIRPELATVEAVKTAIDHCPSGALKYVLGGSAAPAEPIAEGAAGVSIRISSNGPLMVEGHLELFDENDRPVDHSGRLCLCRCGATQNPPFCDGTHGKIGWTPKKERKV